MQRALVFSYHPDDEVIAIGGTIKKLSLAGVEVTVVYFAIGDEGYTRLEQKDTIVEIRKEETKK